MAVDVPEGFLTDAFAALTFAALALRLEATDFLIAATDNDFRDLAEDLGVPAVFVAAAFLLEALLFLTGLLLTALIVISESVLPNLSVFDVLTFTGALGTVTFGEADSSQLESPNFSISLDGVPLGPLSEWTSETLGAEYPLLKGNLNGHASLDLHREHATANLQWQDAAVNEFDFGDLCLAMTWSDQFEGQLQQFFGEEESSPQKLPAPRAPPFK